jgi:hypothetical protein
VKKRKRLKTVRGLDRQTGQYSETRGLRSAAFNVSTGLPSTSDETAGVLWREAEAFLDIIGETTPHRIVETCGADRAKILSEMKDLMTRLNSKYGVFSPEACAGKFLVTRQAVMMAVFDLLFLLGWDIQTGDGILQKVDEFADAWHWWHAESKGEHVSAAAKTEEADRLRKQGRTIADKAETRAGIIEDLIDKLPHPRGSIASQARAIYDDAQRLFKAKGLAPANSASAFYEEVRHTLGKVKKAKPSGISGSEID